MNKSSFSLLLAVMLPAVVALAVPPRPESNPMPGQHDQDRKSGVNARGDEAMGFSHARTAHHFLLFEDGGAIEVEANDPGDKTSREEVRQHLRHIAQAFSHGDFDIPMFIHAESPPGVPTMKRLRQAISYRFENTDHGGRVRIFTKNAEAADAVREFLRFQIRDHRTGDRLEITSSQSESQ